MPQNESIIFSPELDERQLDRETDQINDRLAQVGSDIPVNFDGEMGGMDGGGGGIGGTAGAAGLASRIPKPIAGVSAGAALPAALVGSVGVGMLGAMQQASARLQTSNTLFGQAWNNFWRPLGDNLDKLFIRDLASDLVDETQQFEETLRSGDWAGAFSGMLTGIFPDEGTIARNMASSVGLALAGPFGARIATGILEDFKGVVDRVNVPDFPDIPQFPGWPSLPQFNWPSLPPFQWPNIGLPQWPSAGDILMTFPDISAQSLMNAILGRDTGGGGGGDLPLGGFNASERARLVGRPDNPMVGLQTGGRVTKTGVAQVHRGELVADPDRLVSELASAVSSATGGGGGGTVDMRNVERKLDRLNQNVTRLAAALSEMEIKTDRETIGRVASDGKRQRIADRDPTA